MEKDDKIDSVIGKKTVIKGSINVEGSVKIDGTIEGNISTNESVILGKDSAVKGNIECKSAIIGGRVEGNVNVQDVLELQSGTHLSGDIVCCGLIIKEGVFFEGNCQMSQKSKDKQ